MLELSGKKYQALKFLHSSEKKKPLIKELLEDKPMKNPCFIEFALEMIIIYCLDKKYILLLYSVHIRFFSYFCALKVAALLFFIVSSQIKTNKKFEYA